MAESGAPEQQREDSTEQGHAPWDAQTHQVSAALAGPAAPPPMAWPAHSVQRSLGWLSHWRGVAGWHVQPAGPGAHSPRLLWPGHWGGPPSVLSTGKSGHRGSAGSPGQTLCAGLRWLWPSGGEPGHTLLPSRGLLGAGTRRP